MLISAYADFYKKLSLSTIVGTNKSFYIRQNAMGNNCFTTGIIRAYDGTKILICNNLSTKMQVLTPALENNYSHACIGIPTVNSQFDVTNFIQTIFRQYDELIKAA